MFLGLSCHGVLRIWFGVGRVLKPGRGLSSKPFGWNPSPFGGDHVFLAEYRSFWAGPLPRKRLSVDVLVNLFGSPHPPPSYFDLR